MASVLEVVYHGHIFIFKRDSYSTPIIIILNINYRGKALRMLKMRLNYFTSTHVPEVVL